MKKPFFIFVKAIGIVMLMAGIMVITLSCHRKQPKVGFAIDYADPGFWYSMGWWECGGEYAVPVEAF